jgi:hypothetical protein
VQASPAQTFLSVLAMLAQTGMSVPPKPVRRNYPAALRLDSGNPRVLEPGDDR